MIGDNDKIDFKNKQNVGELTILECREFKSYRDTI
jgi:hypothetical protein